MSDLVISVYKTSIVKKSEIAVLRPFLNHMGKWNFDLQDCDRILRIESHLDISGTVTEFLNKNGFSCEELL